MSRKNQNKHNLIEKPSLFIKFFDKIQGKHKLNKSKNNKKRLLLFLDQG